MENQFEKDIAERLRKIEKKISMGEVIARAVLSVAVLTLLVVTAAILLEILKP